MEIQRARKILRFPLFLVGGCHICKFSLHASLARLFMCGMAPLQCKEMRLKIVTWGGERMGCGGGAGRVSIGLGYFGSYGRLSISTVAWRERGDGVIHHHRGEL